MPRIIITLLTFIALLAGDLRDLDLRGFNLGPLFGSNLGGLLHLAGLIATANAAEPPKDPILRIETGRHTAQIRQIATDAAGRWLVTASDDKSLRICDLGGVGATGRSPLQDMQPTRIIRPPIGEGNEGKLYSVAISPDGATIASGGWTKLGSDTGNAIYLFNRATGSLTGRITGLPNGIAHLAFSPDGRYLAASLGGKNGIRLYAAGAKQGSSASPLLVGEDKDYGGVSYSTHFSADGRLVTTSDDGYIRLYMAEATDRSPLQLITKIKSPDGNQPYAARFSPDGSKVAVGYKDTTSVSVLSCNSLSPLYSPDISGVQNGNLSKVAWSADGRYLYAGGGWAKQFDGDWKCPIRRWSDAGKGGYSDTAAADNTIKDISPLPDGSMAFGSADPAFGMIDSLGKRTLFIPPAIADYRNNKEKFLLSSDGSQVGFGYEQWGKSPYTFDLSGRTLTPDTAQGLLSPITSKSGINITDWLGTTEPKLNGTPLKLKQYEISRSLAIAPDGNSFILGTEWQLRRFNRQGEQIWEVPVPGIIWEVNVAPNGIVAVAAYADGTIRWHRMSDGKELAAFFPHADKKRWVLWTPEGFFDHSPGGEELIGYHLNRGKDKEAEFVPVAKMYNAFYRPDLVSASFAGKDISEYARAVDVNRLLTVKTLPPKVRLITKSGASDKPEINLKAEVCDNGGGIGDVTIFLNGTPVVLDSGGRGLKRADKKELQQCAILERPLSLDNGVNRIAIMAYNRDNTIESDRDTVDITHKSAFTGKPDLHILTIAVDKYRDGDLQLKYSNNDAKAIGAALANGHKNLFGKVHNYTMSDAEVTRDNLKQKFIEIGKKTRREDLFVLFVAGHGITNEKDGAYYYLPVNFRYSQAEDIPKQGVSMHDFKEYLANINASKSLLLLDTCNSGSFAEAIASRGVLEKTAINKLARAIGRATVVASSKSQVALEGYQGHGAFSWVTIEGVKGKAADNKGRITVNSLVSYIENTLPELTFNKWGYEQIPQKNLMGEDFQIGGK